MNKQEAIEAIEQDKIQLCRIVETNSEVNSIQRKIKMVDYVPLETVVSMIDKIDEPQKVAVPKFVAEWIEELKKSYSNLAWVWQVYPAESKIKNWLKSNTEIFALAWIYGYEVEQEKLYTVEIPNPNSAGGKLVLFKQQSTGRLILDMLNPNINKPKYLHLTECEIKQDFEWAWNAGFAKEVKE